MNEQLSKMVPRVVLTRITSSHAKRSQRELITTESSDADWSSDDNAPLKKHVNSAECDANARNHPNNSHAPSETQVCISQPCDENSNHLKQSHDAISDIAMNTESCDGETH